MKDNEDQTSVMEVAGNRQSVIVRTSIVGIVTNIALSLMKGIIGVLSNSIAVILDAINNAL